TAEEVEGIGGDVQQTLQVDLEVVSVLAVAAEDPPLERRRLPIAAAHQGPRVVGNDVPAGNREREVELPDAQDPWPRHEVYVSGRLPDPRAAHEAERRSEVTVDAVERDEVVEQVVGVVGGDPPGD